MASWVTGHTACMGGRSFGFTNNGLHVKGAKRKKFLLSDDTSIEVVFLYGKIREVCCIWERFENSRAE